MFMEKKYILY